MTQNKFITQKMTPNKVQKMLIMTTLQIRMIWHIFRETRLLQERGMAEMLRTKQKAFFDVQKKSIFKM